MLPQYIGGATVFGVVANLVTDTDKRVLRHPAVKRMALDTVQWGEQTGREIFAGAVACVGAPAHCLRPNKRGRLPPTLQVESAAPPPAQVDTAPPRDSCSASTLNRIFTSPFDDPPLEPATIVARDDVSPVSTLERVFTCAVDDEPAPEPIVIIRDDVCVFASGMNYGTQVIEPAACVVDDAFYNGSNPYVGLKTVNVSSSLPTLGAPVLGFGFGFAVIALAVGVLLARFLFAFKRKRDRWTIKRASKDRRRVAQRAALKAKKAAEERKVAMNTKPNWIALRNYTTLAVSLHRYDTVPPYAPLHTIVRDYPPVNTGPPDINLLIDLDAFIDDGPFGLNTIALANTPTPLLGYPGTDDDFLGLGVCTDIIVSAALADVEGTRGADDLVGFPAVNSGLALAAFVEYDGVDVDLLGFNASEAKASLTVVVETGVAASLTAAAGLSTILEDALVAADSSSALHEQAISASVSVSTLLDLLSVHGDTVIDAPPLLAEAASLPSVASIIASG